MICKSLSGWSGIRLVTLAAGTLLCVQARAEWGSIRANNRSQREVRSGQQSRSVAVPRPGREEGREREGERFQRREPVISAERGREGEQRREGERHWEEGARERRHLDIDEDRRHGFFWSGISPGMFFGTLPSGYVPLNVGSTPYYYYDGAYYEQSPSGYVAVNPPIGAVVPALPPGAEAVAAGPNVYYYAGGAFYLQGPQGFSVVPPPLGVTISQLPPGATPVYIRGIQYYQYNGAYFLPVMEGGVVVYTTVQP